MIRKGNINIEIVLYKSKTLASGEHPLMLRLTQNRKRKYLAIGGISCSPKLWDFKNNRPKSSHPNIKLLKAIISKKKAVYEKQVLEFEESGKEFTLDGLIIAVEKPKRRVTVLEYFKEVIKMEKDSHKIGNSRVYTETMNSLNGFINGKDITFSDIDYSFLLKYEAFMRANGNTDNTISVRFRTLRAILNRAIKENLLSSDLYPFKKFKLGKFNTSTRKRALCKEDIKRIEAKTLTDNDSMVEAQHYFLFSYYGLGINFVDIANLKWSNIVNDRVFYSRAKTGKELNFKLTAEAIAILDYWRPLTVGNNDNYIFPILDKTKHISSIQIDNRIHKVITRTNRDLKKIGKDLNIETPLTTYVARHSMATVLKRSGVSTTIISQAMGHKTEAITQTYLKSFEDDIIDNAQSNL